MIKILFYILVLLLPALLIAALYELRHRNRGASIIIKRTIRIFLLINLIGISILHYCYGLTNLFNPIKISYRVILYFLLNSLLIGFIYLAMDYLSNRLIKLNKRENKPTTGSYVLFILGLLLFFIGTLASTSAAWANTVYYNSPPDQIFITILTPITGTDSKLIMSYIEGPLILALTISYIFYLFAITLIFYRPSLKNDSKLKARAYMPGLCSLCGLIVLIIGLAYGILSLDLDKIIIGYTVEGKLIEEEYVSPNSVKIEAPDKKRNFIHIYLESIENSYFDKANGGIMDTNLMPNLLRLYQEGDSFSNRAKGIYGGPLKTYGGSFSCGSMVNQFFGLPMRIPTEAGMYAKKGHFLPGAIGLGDILKAYGYNQTLLMGSDSDFGGLTNLYRDHGGFNIIDYKYAKEKGLIPSDYRVNWGFEDEKLYELSKAEILRLAALPEPFNVIVENADTHNPGFSFSGSEPIFGETDIPSDYAKTISFSERHVYEFVKWLQNQDFYSNTTILIIGDHNTMDPSLFKDGRDKGYTRTTYSLILNPAPEIKRIPEAFYNRSYANFDMLPTILTALGFKIEGDRLGLGVNLYSNKKTLYEEKGYEYINKELVYKSSFYHNSFVKGKAQFQK